jgi:hypothetical protein
MPWGELKKEDLVKAGLDPDNVSAMSTKINNAASKDDVNELKTALASTQETLKNLENSLRGLATAKEGNSDDGNRDNQNQNRDQNQNRNQGPQPVNIDPLQFMEDPQGAVRRLVNEGLGPITMHSLNVAAEMAYSNAKQRLPHFVKFEPEIKELWDKYGPTQKGNATELIENLYNLVRGRHMDEILTDTNKRDGKYNLVQSGGTSVVGRAGSGSSDRKPEDDLDPKEIEIAARFGMTPKEWAEQKGGLKYV